MRTSQAQQILPAVALLHSRTRAPRTNLRMAGLAARPIFELPASDDVPTEMRLLAAGINRTQKGDFLFDAQAANDVMAFWSENAVDLTFDYEHQALQDPPIEAPASCWKWTPEIRNGELWATGMAWTERAANYIRAKEYRYWSPALLFSEESMRVQAVINVALTNIPATKGIAPLIAASANSKENDMDFEKLCAELRAQNATLTAELASLTAKLTALSAKDDKEGEKDEEALSAAVGLRASAARPERLAAVTSLATLRKSVRDLTGEDNDAGAIGKLTAWKKDAGDVATLRADTEKASEASLKAELETVLADGAKAGKVPPSEDHEIRKSLRAATLAFGGGKLSKDGVAWLKGHVGGLAKIAPGSEAEVKTQTGSVALSANSIAIAKRMGIDTKKFAEFQTKRLSQRAAG